MMRLFNKQNLPFDWQDYIYKTNILFEIPDTFDIKSLIKIILIQLQLENYTLKYIKFSNLYLIQYQESKSFVNKLGFSSTFHLFLKVKNSRLYLSFCNANWLNEIENIKALNLRKNSFLDVNYDHKIVTLVGQTILYFLENNDFPKNTDVAISEPNQGRYIENYNLPQQIGLQNRLQEEEFTLAFLEISSLKQFDNQENIPEFDKLFYWLTSQKSTLLFYDKNSQISLQKDVTNLQMNVSNSIGRNTITFGKSIICNTTLSNDSLFQEIAKINCLTNKNDRIREIACLNWIHKEKDPISNQFAFQLIQKLVSKTDNPFDKLSLIFIDLAQNNRKKIITKSIDNEELVKIITKISNYSDTNILLQKWAKKWQISYLDKTALLHLFLAVPNLDKSQYLRFLAFHRLIREEFLKNNKNDSFQIIFDIDFSKHLIMCNLKNEAIDILNELLTKIPDETLLDLLPPSDLDLTDTTSGQMQRIKVLELLVEAKGQNDATNLITQLAQFQPLIPERLELLIQVSKNTLQQRAKKLHEILAVEGMKYESKSPQIIKYQKFTNEHLENYLPHPATRSGGIMNSLQNWIANIEVPDYPMVQEYGERVHQRNYPELSAKITDMLYALSMNAVECYIAHGKKGIGIQGYEAETSFLVIGNEHLNTKSTHYLDLKMLEFAIGTELAHLYFQHSRITSSDVWDGAKDKGLFVLDTLLTVLPGVGMLGNTLKQVPHLQKVSSILSHTSKITDATSKGKEVFDFTSQIFGAFQKKDNTSETNKENELLAHSRMVQLTADRVGLVFCGDLKAVLRSIFLTSKRYTNELPMVERYGILELLTKKDAENNYIFQDLAIRLVALFSFYLSDEYDILKKHLLPDNQ